MNTEETRQLQKMVGTARWWLGFLMLATAIIVLIGGIVAGERVIKSGTIACIVATGDVTGDFVENPGYETWVGVLPMPDKEWKLRTELTEAPTYYDIPCGPTDRRVDEDGRPYLVLTERGKIAVSHGDRYSPLLWHVATLTISLSFAGVGSFFVGTGLSYPEPSADEIKRRRRKAGRFLRWFMFWRRKR